jgi:hypothetical protein
VGGVTTVGVGGSITVGVGGVTTAGVGGVTTVGVGGVTTAGVGGVTTVGAGGVTTVGVLPEFIGDAGVLPGVFPGSIGVEPGLLTDGTGSIGGVVLGCLLPGVPENGSTAGDEGSMEDAFGAIMPGVAPALPVLPT